MMRKRLRNLVAASLGVVVLTLVAVAGAVRGADDKTPKVVWGEAVNGLRCGARVMQEKLGFGKAPVVEVTLENTTDKPINVVGPAERAHNAGTCYPCAYVSIEDQKGDFSGHPGEEAGVVPKVVMVEPGKSWTFEFRLGLDKDFKPGQMPSLNLYLPGKYKVNASYDAKKEWLKERYYEKGIEFGPVWEGAVNSGTTTFEVIGDDSEQLKILKSVMSGDGVKENLRLELKAGLPVETPNKGGRLILIAHNTGEQTLYLGSTYGLHIKTAEREWTDWGGLRSVSVRAIEPGKWVQLGGWGLGAEKCEVWVEYSRPGKRTEIEILNQSNVLTINGAAKQ
jgi:hypothetical protein